MPEGRVECTVGKNSQNSSFQLKRSNTKVHFVVRTDRNLQIISLARIQLGDAFLHFWHNYSTI